MHRTNVAVFGEQRPRYTQKSRSCSSCTPRLMHHRPGRPVKTRGQSHGHGGHRCSSSSTPHLMGSGPGRPVKTHGPPHGPGRAAHIEPTSHGPRPSPAHQISRGWAAARPGPSNFHMMGRGGPARPIKFSEHGPRPGSAHHIFKFSRSGPARPINFQKSRARPGPLHFQKSRPGSARSVTVFGLARPGPAQTNGPWQALFFLSYPGYCSLSPSTSGASCGFRPRFLLGLYTHT